MLVERGSCDGSGKVVPRASTLKISVRTRKDDRNVFTSSGFCHSRWDVLGTGGSYGASCNAKDHSSIAPDAVQTAPHVDSAMSLSTRGNVCPDADVTGPRPLQQQQLAGQKHDDGLQAGKLRVLGNLVNSCTPWLLAPGS